MIIAALKPVSTQKQLTAALSLIYEVKSFSCVSIRQIHLCNTSGSVVTVQICFVPPGQVASSTNAVLWNFPLGGNDFIEVCNLEIVTVGYGVWASASSAGVMNLFFSAIGE